MRALAGIDLGTTGCKAMLFDLDGLVLGEHYIEYDLIYTPQGIEQDAELWWAHARTAFRRALATSGLNGSQVAGLGICAQGIASVPVAQDGTPLANAVSWYDRRADEQAEDMARRYGAEWLYHTTGRRPGSLMFPQVLWLRGHSPGLYQKAAHFLMAQDYLVYRLCGNAVTDYTMASGTLCFDVSNHRWLDQLFTDYDIDMARFPSLAPFGGTAGTVCPSAAEAWGLVPGTPVAVGLQDQKAAALGAGINAQNITLSLGTASAVTSLVHRYVPDEAVPCHAFDEGRWVLEGTVGTTGMALKWLRGLLGITGGYREMDEMAAQSPPGANGALFVPELAQGRGAFTGMSLSTGPQDMVRSVLEGVAAPGPPSWQAQRRALPGRCPPHQLRVFGGGAKSPLWCQIIADCLQIKVSVPRTQETGNMGAAVCAGMATGLLPNQASIERFTGGASATYTPNAVNAPVYDELYARYLLRAKHEEED